MRCLECCAEIDELNESQPVCPACGTPPGTGRDDDDVSALLDDAALILRSGVNFTSVHQKWPKIEGFLPKLLQQSIILITGHTRAVIVLIGI
jgi:hypothetical protein